MMTRVTLAIWLEILEKGHIKNAHSKCPQRLMSSGQMGGSEAIISGENKPNGLEMRGTWSQLWL